MASQAKIGGNNLSAAFGATGGGLAATRGLVSVADGFKSANAGMALFAASQALLDVGRLSKDMSEVAGATGAAGGAFSKLGAIVKANPLLAIAGGIAAVAGVMGLFGKETAKTAAELDKVIDKLKLIEAQRLGDVSLGLPSAEAEAAKARQASLRALQRRTYTGDDPEYGAGGSLVRGGNVNIRSAARALGLPLDQLLNARQFATSRDDDPRLFELLRQSREAGSTRGPTRLSVDEFRRLIRSEFSSEGSTLSAVQRQNDPNLIQFGQRNNLSFSQPAGYGTGAWLNRPEGVTGDNARIAQYQLQQRQGSALRFGQGAFGPSRVDIDFPAATGDLVSQSPAEQQRVAQESADRALQSMNELVRTGQQFGATIGDGFASIATGAASARQVVAALVQDMIRASARQGFAKLFGAVSGSFGQTGAQASGDAAPDQP